MKQYKVTLSTTHLDKQGEMMTREALDSLAKDANNYYIPMGLDHDPRLPPTGRVVSCTVEPIEDGHFALNGTVELWDDTDGQTTLTGDGRKTRQIFEPIGKFDVLFDIKAFEVLGEPFLIELAELGGNTPQYHIKKAADPLFVITLAIGTFAIAGIANGFLSKLGEDIYEKLKQKLKQASTPVEGSERLLVFHLVVESKNEKVGVDFILTNPTPEDIDNVMSKGFKNIEELVQNVLEKHNRASKIVVEYKNGQPEILFWTRDDGVPSLIKPIEHKKILSRGLSIGGVRKPEK